MSSHQRLGLPKGLFPVALPFKILKALPPSSILATYPVHLNLLDLITLTILGSHIQLINNIYERYFYGIRHDYTSLIYIFSLGVHLKKRFTFNPTYWKSQPEGNKISPPSL